MANEYDEKFQRIHRMPTDELLALTDDFDLVCGVSGRICDLSVEPSSLINQNGPQTVVFLTSTTSGIIGNGGLEYLFEGWYSGDLDYSLTRAAFVSVGAAEWISVFTEVFATLPDYKMPDGVEARHLAFLKISKPQREMWNSRLWDSTEELTAKTAAYIRKNRSCFTMLRPFP